MGLIMTNQAVILAIETATSSCSVALSYQDEFLVRHEVGNNVHSKVLLEMVQSVLNEASINVGSLDAVAVGQGPGSFTGLRIGVGVAQGIAYGSDVPMIGVSSLDALANQACQTGRVIAGIDARMGEVYWAEYLKDEHGVERIGELSVSAPKNITSAEPPHELQLVGNAWTEYEGRFDTHLINNSVIDEAQVYPMADSILRLAQQNFEQGNVIQAIDFAPEYVRNNVAKKSTKAVFKSR